VPSGSQESINLENGGDGDQSTGTAHRGQREKDEFGLFGRSAPKHLQNNLHKLDLVPSQRKPAGMNRRAIVIASAA